MALYIPASGVSPCIYHTVNVRHHSDPHVKRQASVHQPATAVETAHHSNWNVIGSALASSPPFRVSQSENTTKAYSVLSPSSGTAPQQAVHYGLGVSPLGTPVSHNMRNLQSFCGTAYASSCGENTGSVFSPSQSRVQFKRTVNPQLAAQQRRVVNTDVGLTRRRCEVQEKQRLQHILELQSKTEDELQTLQKRVVERQQQLESLESALTNAGSERLWTLQEVHEQHMLLSKLRAEAEEHNGMLKKKEDQLREREKAFDDMAEAKQNELREENHQLDLRVKIWCKRKIETQNKNEENAILLDELRQKQGLGEQREQSLRRQQKELIQREILQQQRHQEREAALQKRKQHMEVELERKWKELCKKHDDTLQRALVDLNVQEQQDRKHAEALQVIRDAANQEIEEMKRQIREQESAKENEKVSAAQEIKRLEKQVQEEQDAKEKVKVAARQEIERLEKQVQEEQDANEKVKVAARHEVERLEKQVQEEQDAKKKANVAAGQEIAKLQKQLQVEYDIKEKIKEAAGQEIERLEKQVQEEQDAKEKVKVVARQEIERLEKQVQEEQDAKKKANVAAGQEIAKLQKQLQVEYDIKEKIKEAAGEEIERIEMQLTQQADRFEKEKQVLKGETSEAASCDEGIEAGDATELDVLLNELKLQLRGYKNEA